MSRLTHIYSVKKILSLLLLFFFSNTISASAENGSLNPSHALISGEKTPMATFQQAVNDDLAGRHSEARQKYDALNNGMLGGSFFYLRQLTWRRWIATTKPSGHSLYCDKTVMGASGIMACSGIYG